MAKIYIRGKSREVLGEARSIEDGDLLLRHLDVGTFSLSLPDGEEAQALATPGAGAIITSDAGVPIASGSIDRIAYSSGSSGVTWTFYGQDDKSLVSGLLGIPDIGVIGDSITQNATSGTAYAAQSFTLTGAPGATMVYLDWDGCAETGDYELTIDSETYPAQTVTAGTTARWQIVGGVLEGQTRNVSIAKVGGGTATFRYSTGSAPASTANFSFGAWVEHGGGSSGLVPVALTVLDEYWSMTGPAETVVKSIVQYNIDRVTELGGVAPITVSPDLGRGSTVTARVRFQPLGEVLHDLCESGGLGWTLISDLDGVLTFDVYEPTDRSLDMLFSLQSGAVSEVDYERQAPKATRVIIGGPGEAVNRALVQEVDTAAEAEWGWVAEAFLDQRQLKTIAEMRQQGSVALFEATDSVRLKVKAIDMEGMTYGVDYVVGDTVPVEVAPNIVVSDRVEEVRLDLSPGQGKVVTPTIGAGEETPINSRMRLLGRALHNLEGSQ